MYLQYGPSGKDWKLKVSKLLPHYRISESTLRLFLKKYNNNNKVLPIHHVLHVQTLLDLI